MLEINLLGAAIISTRIIRGEISSADAGPSFLDISR
jgi:hypothetical protein